MDGQVGKPILRRVLARKPSNLHTLRRRPTKKRTSWKTYPTESGWPPVNCSSGKPRLRIILHAATNETFPVAGMDIARYPILGRVRYLLRGPSWQDARSPLSRDAPYVV